MYILGISAMSHDSAAALLGDSGFLAAIEEGKLERTRTIGGIPREAIQFCLDRTGITWRDVQHVAIASEPSRSWRRQALFRTRLSPFAPVSSGYFLNKSTGELGRELNNVRILKQMAAKSPGRVKSFDHHTCHASSAFYGSPFDRALIVSLDERGDGRAGLVAVGEGNRIRELESVPFPHSLAWVYTQFTQLLGFRARGDEHKTQWLSLAGEEEFANEFIPMLRQTPAGPPHVNGKYFGRDFAGGLSFTKEFCRCIGAATPDSPKNAHHFEATKRANIAASIQKAIG